MDVVNDQGRRKGRQLQAGIGEPGLYFRPDLVEKDVLADDEAREEQKQNRKDGDD